MNDRVSGHRLRAIEHALVNSATHTSSFLPHSNRHAEILDLFKKTCFSLFILKSALYKTTREKSLKVKGVGRGEAPLSFGGPSRDWAPGQPSRASHVLAVQLGQNM